MGSNAAVCNLQILFAYHYPERSNTHVSVFLTIVDWSKDDSTYRFLLSTLMVGQPPNRKGAIESLKGDESFRICNPSNWSSWHLLMTNRDAMHSLFIPPFSIIFTHSYHAVLSLQFFASCVAWDPSFQEVDAAWQGTWKAFALDFLVPSIDSALLF